MTRQESLNAAVIILRSLNGYDSKNSLGILYRRYAGDLSYLANILEGIAINAKEPDKLLTFERP